MGWSKRPKRCMPPLPTAEPYHFSFLSFPVVSPLVYRVNWGYLVPNLMSAQAAARAGEMALPFSLGARRNRLVRMVLVASGCGAESAPCGPHG